MPNIQRYNNKFDIDVYALASNNALVNMIRSNPNAVQFHLQCAVSAYNNEHGLRFLPDPRLYLLHLTDNSLKLFIEDIEASEKIVSSLSLHANTTKCSDHNLFVKYFKLHQTIVRDLLYFILFSCDLTLNGRSAQFGKKQIFTVRRSEEKEEQFKKLKGNITYLYHVTSLQSVYSICRNGIKNMSRTRLRAHGSSCGPGIYLSDAPNHYGDVVLCYAVKNASKYHKGFCYVVKSEKQICLRAIFQRSSFNMEILDKLIKGFQQQE